LCCQFPKLKHDSGFRIIEPAADVPLERYNCWAYALGKTDTFWAYNAEWPLVVDRRPSFPDHLDACTEMMQYFGYAVCSAPFGHRPENFQAEQGVEKVALYVRQNRNAQGTSYQSCPHVAKQLPSGHWASKNNIFEIFEHAPESLESEPDAGLDEPWLQNDPEECKERRANGFTFIWRPLNFGRLALVMSRQATSGK
jgi:hypothetical protein